MKRSDNIAWSQLKVGIFILVALVCAGAGIIMMGRQTKMFIPTGTISVIMKDAAGLKVGAPVWVAGLDVGVVTDIRFEKPRETNAVEVLLEIEDQALRKIGPDSVVAVKTRGLMGEKYVDITPSARVYDTPPSRLEGVPTARLDDVMQKASTAFDSVQKIIGKVGGEEGSAAKFINDPKLYDNLASLTHELDRLITHVNAGQGTLGKLATSDDPYEKMMAILARTDATLEDIRNSKGSLNRFIHDPKLYNDLVLLTERAIRAGDEVRALNNRLTSRESTVGMFLTDRSFYDKGMALMERADNSLKSLEEVTRRLRDAEGTAGKLVSERELYDRINRVVEEVSELVKDVKENPRRYLKFSVF